MLVTLLPIVTLVSPEQPLNASSPMLVTLLGISMLLSPEQDPKAPTAILNTPLGIMVFLQPAINVLLRVSIMALQLFLLS